MLQISVFLFVLEGGHSLLCRRLPPPPPPPLPPAMVKKGPLLPYTMLVTTFLLPLGLF